MSAIGIGLGVAQGIAGMAMQGSQDRRQVRQQEKLQKLQIQGAKEMSDYEKEQQLDMWNKTNYGAQVDHLEKAGLNSALMYGMSGGGGTTTGGGGGGMPTGASAEAPSAGTKNIMDMAMMDAQRKVLESQAKKNEAEAEATAGVKTEEIKARTLDLLQGIENKKAIEKLTGVQNRISEVQADIAENTAGIEMQRITWAGQTALEGLQQAQNETYISNETYKEKAKQITLTTLGMMLDNESKKKGIELTETQINGINQKIAQEWEALSQRGEQINIQEFEANIRAEHPGVMQVIGGEMKRVINKYNNLVGDRGGYYRVDK